jgi:hypothetical protein
MDLQQQTKNIMLNAIKKFAETDNLKQNQVQFIIATEDNKSCTPKYLYMKKHIPDRVVSFNEILGVKIDFLGREMIASPFMAKTIRRLSMEQNISPDQVKVLIWSKGESDVSLYFFANKKPIKELTFDYIFEGI